MIVFGLLFINSSSKKIHEIINEGTSIDNVEYRAAKMGKRMGIIAIIIGIFEIIRNHYW
jgi:hypothetical protein